MNYLREIQRRIKEIESSRWVSYFLQIPLIKLFLISNSLMPYFKAFFRKKILQNQLEGPLSIKPEKQHFLPFFCHNFMQMSDI
jgi:hypothetical protein